MNIMHLLENFTEFCNCDIKCMFVHSARPVLWRATHTTGDLGENQSSCTQVGILTRCWEKEGFSNLNKWIIHWVLMWSDQSPKSTGAWIAHTNGLGTGNIFLLEHCMFYYQGAGLSPQPWRSVDPFDWMSTCVVWQLGMHISRKSRATLCTNELIESKHCWNIGLCLSVSYLCVCALRVQYFVFCPYARCFLFEEMTKHHMILLKFNWLLSRCIYLYQTPVVTCGLVTTGPTE